MNTTTEIFPWNVNFETGISTIDEQHKVLVALVNKLASHLAYGSDDLTLNQVLDELTDYTVYHFKTEEAIWNKTLPLDEKSLVHQQTHKAFIDEIIKARLDDESLGSEKVIEGILGFLTHWLAFHILDDDMTMAKIVFAVQEGLSVEEAKEQALRQMNGAMKVLIETVLTMYDSLSSRTLDLMREVARRQRVEQRLRLSKDVINSTLEAIFITDEAGIIIDANPSFCRGVNSTLEKILGKDVRDVKPSLFEQEIVRQVWASANKVGHWSGELFGVSKKGNKEVFWLTLSAVKDEVGNVSNYAGVLSSISHLIERQHSLEVEANHDILTGLANRRLLDDRLSQAMIHNDRNNRKLAICYLDLDGFKAVNDSLGHDAGDMLLCEIASRLSKTVRGEDTVARVGGDEFVVLFGDLVKESDLDTLLQKLLMCIKEPVFIDDQEVKVSASIGATLYPRIASTREDLLKIADKAMYTAKKAGKSRFHIDF